MALKAIVNEDYEDYVKSFAGGINSSIVPVVTDGEEADEKAVEKRNIKQRTSHEFDIAFDGRKSLGSPTILEEDEAQALPRWSSTWIMSSARASKH